MPQSDVAMTACDRFGLSIRLAADATLPRLAETFTGPTCLRCRRVVRQPSEHGCDGVDRVVLTIRQDWSANDE